LLPFVLLLPVVGFGWGHWDRALELRGAWNLLWVVLAWGCLQAGTLWLNAALDRDQGEVLLGRATPVPVFIVPCGYAILGLAVGLAFLADPGAGYAALGCAILAVLYSHPSTVWKGHPLFGPLVNGAGYGLLSTFAGWRVVGVTPNPRTVAVWLLGGLGVLGCYFAAQAFQEEEDRQRGYRTLVVTHGPRGCLLASRLCLGVGFLGGVLLTALGWLPLVCFADLPLGWWVDDWLRRWAAQPGGGNERWARGLAFRLLVSVVVAIGLAYVAYYWELMSGEPVAGLGTRSGLPTD